MRREGVACRCTRFYDTQKTAGVGGRVSVVFKLDTIQYYGRCFAFGWLRDQGMEGRIYVAVWRSASLRAW